MSDIPKFFIPPVPPEKSEEVYTRLAATWNCPVPAPDKRIYSVTFSLDGVEWVASVGKQLTGTRYYRADSYGQVIHKPESITENLTIFAILRGDAYYIMTDKYYERRASKWDDTIILPHVLWVTYFANLPE